MNQPLPKPLRTQLKNTVKAAREAAEKGAKAALSLMAVAEAKVPEYLVSDEQKSLRRRLRAHGRALGDVKAKDDSQGTQHLMWEVAYEHWHRMLFARFLAENGLLMWEPGAPVSLDDCRDMVDNHPDMAMGAKSHWELAGKLAARMLPQVFKPQSPVFELAFAPEHQRELERLLAALPPEVFNASDSLGWVYQFWQAKRKDEVNASEVKIGADELPAVTQLFTEPYMVDFLLHNSLGAWWVTRHPGKTCPVPLTYLRTLEDGTPTAGKFEGWPDRLDEFTLLDPCCGSGHFLVAAFLMLVPMRMAAEGLSALDAVDAVLVDNLHGLELDARCVEIAVFALALSAWRYPDECGDSLGVRAEMPAPQVACCGLKMAATPQDWAALVPDSQPNAAVLRQELRLLHGTFAQAPLLGSLLDPARSVRNDLATSGIEELNDLLERALAIESPTTWSAKSELADDVWDLALTARGLLEATRLLNRRYHLVATNVPYRKRADHCDALRDFIDDFYPEARSDLANVFIDRCIELVQDDGALFDVTPQNWLFLSSYRTQRKRLLETVSWPILAKLGPGAFQEIGGHVVKAALVSFVKKKATTEASIAILDVANQKTAALKATALLGVSFSRPKQRSILATSDHRLQANPQETSVLLERYAIPYQGLTSGDNPMFVRSFWEAPYLRGRWELVQSASMQGEFDSGRESSLLWDGGKGALAASPGARVQGTAAWAKRGITVSQMAPVRVSPYFGGPFDMSCTLLVAREDSFLPALWTYCSSPEFNADLAEIDQKMNVTTATVGKVPFDIEEWSAAADSAGLTQLPTLQSHAPTQWIFHGHPQPAYDTLQVAVARLAGYCWPAETDASMRLGDEARTWIAHCDKLAEHADDDGIVCLPPVRGEPAAHDRLLKLLIASWETVQLSSWKPAVLNKLLADADCAGKGLDVWLREKFFEQHAKRFHHRPFIWHVWDGQKDGFAALVNYHKLDTKNLERLIHTYLGRWISDQEDGMRNGVDGAPTRLAAARDLKRRLELILDGEKPYDIFLRWKLLAEQPIGWNPDLDDGVRMNIRPFMTAEVLRHNKKPKLDITWDKDRGKDVESAPWFKVFKGERINDHHLSLAEKTDARSRV